MINNLYSKKQFRKIFQSVKIRLFFSENNFDEIQVSRFPEGLNNYRKDPPIRDIDEKKGSIVLYTSGSTGVPKGVVWSHKDMVKAIIIGKSTHSISKNDRVLLVLTISYIAGFLQLLDHVSSGSAIIFHKIVFIRDTAKIIEKEKITFLSAFPKVWLDLMNCAKKGQLKSLKHIKIMGAEMSREELFQLKSYFNNAKFQFLYGQTEIARSLYLCDEDLLSHANSSGKKIKGCKLLLINEKKLVCKDNEIGELVHVGPYSMSEYLNDPKMTSSRRIRLSLIKNCPFKEKYGILTGDYFKKDNKGFYYFYGRKDQMIKRRGFRIYLQEIENILKTNHKLNEVCVVYKNSLITLFVSLKKKADTKEILDYCKRHLPYYMIPERIKILKKLPRNKTGKIDRKLLGK